MAEQTGCTESRDCVSVEVRTLPGAGSVSQSVRRHVAMPVSQDQAVQIASDFVRQHRAPDAYALRAGAATARHERGGYGTDRLGMGGAYWSVMFEIEVPEDVVVSPDVVIVYVDEETGRAEFFPGL